MTTARCALLGKNKIHRQLETCAMQMVKNILQIYCTGYEKIMGKKLHEPAGEKQGQPSPVVFVCEGRLLARGKKYCEGGELQRWVPAGDWRGWVDDEGG